MMKLRNLDKAHLLEALGLEEKHDPVSMLLPIIGAALGGIVIGAAAALLFAPKTGSEMRGSLRDYVTHKHQDEEASVATTGSMMPDATPRY